jgi:nucleotide-binding universal stress UspA family protein
MKILLAVDGSEGSLHAARYVIETERLYRDPLHIELVTVHLPVPKVGGLSNVVIDQSMIDNYYRDEGNAALAPSRALLDEAGLPYTPHILVGDVAETLIAHAAASGCREICLGTRGMTAIANLVMGSIATRVVHLATIPVTLVK